jgi:hypothetical protein
MNFFIYFTIPILISLLFSLNLSPFGSIYATASSDTLEVPTPFCIVEGTPTHNSSQIYDRDTGEIVDALPVEVIDDRLSKINEIYEPARIEFYSAIRDSINPSDEIPIISDPNPILGTIGNVTIDDFGRNEWKAMISECKLAWQDKFADDRAIGFVAINIKQFVDRFGGVDRDLLGVSSCKMDRNTGLCGLPFSGSVFVKDIQYTGAGFNRGLNNDPLDQNAAHEFGHLGGLNHIPNSQTALMSDEQRENGPGGTVSNIFLSAPEIDKLRKNYENAPGAHYASDSMPLESVTEFSIIDIDNYNINSILPFQNISAVSLTIGQDGNMTVGTELDGFIRDNSTKYWTLLDLDGDKLTGSKNGTLDKIGLPITNITGIELVILGNLSTINDDTMSNSSNTQAWNIDSTGTNITVSNPDLIDQSKETVIFEFDFKDSIRKQISTDSYYYDIINHKLIGYGDILNSTTPLSMYVMVTANNTVLDEVRGQVNDLNKNEETKHKAH